MEVDAKAKGYGVKDSRRRYGLYKQRTQHHKDKQNNLDLGHSGMKVECQCLSRMTATLG